MIKIFGRADSSAVARVMWTIGELQFEYSRVDWGGHFGGNDDEEYRRKNPSGMIPAVELDDGRCLWESKSIIRYLCSITPNKSLLPSHPYARAQVEAWMDWSDIFAEAVNNIRKTYKSEQSGWSDIANAIEFAEPHLTILDNQLANKDFVCDEFSAADIALGVWAHRYYRIPQEINVPEFANIDRWISKLQSRPAYQKHVMKVVSAAGQPILANI